MASSEMEVFDPYSQLVSFLAADGETLIEVPISAIDLFNEESVSVSINYGAQLGACIIMLFVILVMTPSNKFRRPSSVLHIAALVVSIIRMALLSAYFPSPFNEFYNFWSGDYSNVPLSDYCVSIAGNTFSLILVMVIEAAMFNQAWAMVSLWPSAAKYTLSMLSIGITLVTIGWRIAFTVIQNEAVLSLVPPANTLWVAQAMVVTNALSICWFCALFNVKIVTHLVTNRSVLPANRSITPMEILIMTNGLLMVIPVIFTGLEWGHFAKFEAASLALTSVALILPMGTLAAQRVSQSYGLAYNSTDSKYPGGATLRGAASALQPLKGTYSFAGSSRTGPTQHISVSSRCEAAATSREHLDPVDVELGQIDRREQKSGQVRVHHGFEQREERL